MIFSIIKFELSKRFKRISTYVYFAVFFAFAMLLMSATGGAFEGVTVSAGASNREFVNSPYNIFIYTNAINLFAMIVVAAIMGQSIYQDFDHRIYPLFFTKPVSKLNFLVGRFSASLITLIFITSSIGIGFWLTSMAPWVESELFGPNSIMNYINPYMVAIIPNIIFVGLFFMGLAAVGRKMFPVYVGAIMLLIGYLISGKLLVSLDNETLAALLDPFGSFATRIHTKYWSIAQKNTQLIPLSGMILVNRLVYLSLGLTSFLLTLKFFTFSQLGLQLRRKSKESNDIKDSILELPKVAIPKTQPIFGFNHSRKVFQTLVFQEFFAAIKNVYFIAILLCGILFMFVTSSQLGTMFGTQTFPVTYMTIEQIGGFFGLFVLIILTFYSGEMIWRERDAKIDQIHDALPINTGIIFGSKASALLLIEIVLMVVVFICCILIQASRGYFNFEFALYFKSLFGLQLLDYFFLGMFALAIHTLVNNKYLGHFFMIVYYVLLSFMSQFGLEHRLFQVLQTSSRPYSDMNEFGHFLISWQADALYWGGFVLLLAVFSNLFWVRGKESAFKQRIMLARQRMSPIMMAFTFIGMATFIGFGGYIYYNTNILNTYTTTKDGENQVTEYEKNYKKYEKNPHPRITDVYTEVDIFPATRQVKAKGHYVMSNKTNQPINEIFINMNSNIDIKTMEFDRETKISEENKDFGIYIYQLSQPLNPGEKMQLNFNLSFEPKGFANGGSNTQVVYNGSFFNNRVLFPSLGYSEQGEMSNDRTRKKHGLPEKPRMASIDDAKALQNTYLATDSDWINFETIVSTSADQIALSPGYLQKEWQENGRRYFHYKMDNPILHFYSYLSARYEVKRDSHNGINLEIYYQKGHEYNLDSMMQAMKDSLDYFSANFSPYQHKQMRILEFPRYAAFAQSFPNTVPFSEAIGFIADVDPKDEKDLDYPYYVTAHELAHQWWAHQVIGANVQGATMLSETFSQYSALMVMKKKYGDKKMQRFLSYELDRYLRGRSTERKKEMPLYLNEQQQYIHYNKGSMIMYALQDYLGEETVNLAMANYIKEVGFQSAPYTTSKDFLRHLRAVTPENQHYLIADFFENITLYDLRAVKANYTELEDGKYQVTLDIKAKKVHSDEIGNETDQPLREMVDIGVIDTFGEYIYLKKHAITSKDSTITITVDSEPKKAGIDPLTKLIDREPKDNTISVTKAKEKVKKEIKKEVQGKEVLAAAL